ncbi:MAG: GTP-binding protein TypA/BipA [Alphaproteobacteria bacterium MarineAlpha12_Bin1]|jgi:GTP-binding protein|nr:MAG: GTP-binding protein TypA/BipA [Alphaproteobacteria bacterium MarineAlpha12_Bin1]|tara:strand:- start:679 stop:2520 length:1842 start_codon:yes stop_codon:yes gene_type:complete
MSDTESTSADKLRNIAIVAHVDHGKTTLVDKLLRQSGTLVSYGETEVQERVMDSNDIERERGITILSKNTAIEWDGWNINIVDTPGHADFGGEVERVLSMVDSVLLLVDAVEGPMPQTTFVTRKALEAGLNPVLVVNKVDRDGARPDWAVDQTFDLFVQLGATDDQLDFTTVFSSATEGWASLNSQERGDNMEVLFKTIIEHVKAPSVDRNGPFRLQVSSLDYSSYVGVIGIGRIERGSVARNDPVSIISVDGTTRQGRLMQILGFSGLKRIEKQRALAGDIIAFSGIDELKISDTVCSPEAIDPLPPLTVDQPTISMTFQVNDSPFAGKEGKFVTSRNLRDRLMEELLHNVALRVEEMESADRFKVSGRGELHLSILVENMRREGYELAISRPEVIIKEIDGKQCEPYESLSVDIDEGHQGQVMELFGERRAELKNMIPDGSGRVRLDYIVPTRGLIGVRSSFLTLTSGSGLMYHAFDHYGPHFSDDLAQRHRGVLVSTETGMARGYALFNLQERGQMMVDHGTQVYEGMVVGINNRNQDLNVNPLKGKQLTNIRASGTDENIILTPPIKVTLEFALEFIDDDELVEVTPDSIRVRKKFLKEHQRKRGGRPN